MCLKLNILVLIVILLKMPTDFSLQIIKLPLLAFANNGRYLDVGIYFKSFPIVSRVKLSVPLPCC